MAIPVRSRWWIATLVIVGVLLLISALALDRPNVVWDDAEPHCPFCRRTVEMYSSRCGFCRGDFDWVVTPQAESPLSHWSLSVLEAERLRQRVEELGLDVAARLVAEETGLSAAAARDYLGSVGRGDCGWCGGTRKDLSVTDPESTAACPLCLGTGGSIDCGGDRRSSLGDWRAELAAQAYEAELADLLRADLPAETLTEEARRLAELFLGRHAGTVQAGRIYFWQRIGPAGRVPRSRPDARDLAVQVSRDRLEVVLQALFRED